MSIKHWTRSHRGLDRLFTRGARGIHKIAQNGRIAMKIPAPAKTRVQFDFTPEALERLDAIKEKTQAKTRAEVVRNALRLFEWFVDEADPESTIKIVNEDNEIISQFKAKLLL